MSFTIPDYRLRCAQYIRMERERQGLSLTELSELSGLRVSYISDCEHGHRNIGLDNLSRLFNALGLFVGGDNAALHTRARFAENIRTQRGMQGLSQEALAHRAGVHRTFISMVERGVRNISVDNVERIARALGIDEEELLGLERTPAKNATD